MTKHTPRYVLLLDDRLARLIVLEPMPAERWRARVVEEKANTYDPTPAREQGILRPRQDAPNRPAVAAAPPDRKATHRHLFLKEVAEWLDKQLGELDYTRLLVCAAAECYGSLPALVHERLKPRLIFEALELMPLPVSDLPDHKRIRRYLDSGS